MHPCRHIIDPVYRSLIIWLSAKVWLLVLLLCCKKNTEDRKAKGGSGKAVKLEEPAKLRDLCDDGSSMAPKRNLQRFEKRSGSVKSAAELGVRLPGSTNAAAAATPRRVGFERSESTFIGFGGGRHDHRAFVEKARTPRARRSSTDAVYITGEPQTSPTMPTMPKQFERPIGRSLDAPVTPKARRGSGGGGGGGGGGDGRGSKTSRAPPARKLSADMPIGRSLDAPATPRRTPSSGSGLPVQSATREQLNLRSVQRKNGLDTPSTTVVAYL
jgi:hypothetical protein